MPTPRTRKRMLIEYGIAAIVIGLVASIFLPAAFNGLTTSLVPRARNPLVQIAKAYLHFSVSNPEAPQVHKFSIKAGSAAHDAAFVLAVYEGLNDASVWFICNDPKLQGLILPKTVLLGDPKDLTLNPDFAKLPLSFEIAVYPSAGTPITNTPAINAPPTTTPIAWTRGLQADGTWSSDSPWQGAGGHIAYLDGHVEWADKLSLDPNGVSLVKYGTNIPTTDIREALPPGAVILSAEPAKNEPQQKP